VLLLAFDLYRTFEWIENHNVGFYIRSSTYWFPVIESFHLLALAVIGGAVLIVDLRLLGFQLNRQPIAQVARDAEPWFRLSLAVMLVSGLLLFSSEAVKCYYNAAFWIKMVCLALAMLFTFTIQRRALLRAQSAETNPMLRLIAIVSLVLWSGVGFAGRGIGFY
jgi:Family of unknown function (DUF6644)